MTYMLKTKNSRIVNLERRTANLFKQDNEGHGLHYRIISIVIF